MSGAQNVRHQFTQIVNEPSFITVARNRNHLGRVMHIPLSRDEIATFLEVAPVQVDQLWHRHFLQRTLHCPFRPITALSYSSVYDVLEYALVSGVLPVRLSRELAALWVAQLAEADEWDLFSGGGLERKISVMIDLAKEDGLASMTDNCPKVAFEVVATQSRLLCLCADQKDAV